LPIKERNRILVDYDRSRLGIDGGPLFPFNSVYQTTEQMMGAILGPYQQSGQNLLRQKQIPNKLYLNGIKAGEDISRGDVVYISAANTVKKALDSIGIIYSVIGVAAHTASNTEFILVQTYGPITITANGAVAVGDLIRAATGTAGRGETLTRTHTHSIPNISHDLAHVHPNPTTVSDAHTHTVSNTGSFDSAHTHTEGNTTGSIDLGHAHTQADTASDAGGGSHTHGNPVTNSNSDAHSHTNPSTGSSLGSHTHTDSGTGSDSHTHTQGSTGSSLADPETMSTGPTNVEAIPLPGAVVGKAMTVAAGAGNTFVLMVTLS